MRPRMKRSYGRCADLLAQPRGVIRAAATNLAGDDLRHVVVVQRANVLLHVVKTLGRRLHRAAPFLGGLDLVLPPIDAADRAVDLNTRRQSVLDERCCQLVRHFFRVRCRDYLNEFVHRETLLHRFAVPMGRLRTFDLSSETSWWGSCPGRPDFCAEHSLPPSVYPSTGTLRSWRSRGFTFPSDVQERSNLRAGRYPCGGWYRRHESPRKMAGSYPELPENYLQFAQPAISIEL